MNCTFDLILKFGGTSVGSSSSIKLVTEICANLWAQKFKIVVVVSAFSGTTDQLIQVCKYAEEKNVEYKNLIQNLEKRHYEIIKEVVDASKIDDCVRIINHLFNEIHNIGNSIFVLGEASLRTIDLVMSFGEVLSAIIVSFAMKQYIEKSHFVDLRELIKTDDTFGSSRVNFAKTNENLIQYFKKYENILCIATGFIGSTDEGITTTLGRGGSDYTASILGAALNVKEIQIWTDVDGVLSGDPRKISNPLLISEISYEEAMELSYFGAKVIYPPTMVPALEKKIPLRIKNTFNALAEGTLICEKPKIYSGIKITSIEQIGLLNISGSGMVGVAGIAQRLFGALAKNKISVILISQASSEHSICFIVESRFCSLAKKIVEKEFELEMLQHRVDSVEIDLDVAIIAVVGENMKRRIGISGSIFSSLGFKGINVIAIAQGSSELNISLVIKKQDCEKALQTIHDSFYLNNLPAYYFNGDIKFLHIFLAGYGLIGKNLIQILTSQIEFLRTQYQLEVKLIGLANSKLMIIDANGIDLSNIHNQLLEKGVPSHLDQFISEMMNLKLPNSVFVDCTANESIVVHYNKIIDESIHIVAANKKPFTSISYSNYVALKKLAQSKRVSLLHETTVGAGLPVISTLKNLIRTGDKVTQIDAVLSGTLSYIFNSFDGKKPFSKIVIEAKEKGFTEPDPRDDLNGMDVARKILILVREIGLNLELDDIDVENLIPEQFRSLSLDEFLDTLSEADSYFETKRSQSEQEGKVLRYLASYKDGKCSVKLQSVELKHPSYTLTGSDNIIIFTTSYYSSNPLVIRGPGAGAQVTSQGVFADILSLVLKN